MFLALAGLFATGVNAGVIAPITAHLLVTPLRPVEIRLIFGALKKRLRPFVKTSFQGFAFTPISTSYILLLVIGLAVFLAIKVWIGDMTQGAGGNVFITSLIFLIALLALPIVFIIRALETSAAKRVNAAEDPNWLLASVVMMEGLEEQAALARSNMLVNQLPHTARSSRGFVLCLFGLTSLLIVFFTWLVTKQFLRGLGLPAYHVIAIASPFVTLFTILLNPLIGVLNALIYFKARQASGETLKEMLGQ